MWSKSLPYAAVAASWDLYILFTGYRVSNILQIRLIQAPIR